MKNRIAFSYRRQGTRGYVRPIVSARRRLPHEGVYRKFDLVIVSRCVLTRRVYLLAKLFGKHYRRNDDAIVYNVALFVGAVGRRRRLARPGNHVLDDSAFNTCQTRGSRAFFPRGDTETRVARIQVSSRPPPFPLPPRIYLDATKPPAAYL